jgi:hypothetical protein
VNRALIDPKALTELRLSFANSFPSSAQFRSRDWVGFHERDYA